jgi:ABC-type multidrug transport system fused ATPase/permease subunit
MSLRLLSTRDRKLVYFVIAVTIFFGLMDLVGVMLIGAIGSLSVTGVSSGQTGNRVSRLLQSLNIETYSLQTQVGILGTIAALTLISKTILSLIFTKKSLFFLARRGAMISANLVKKYFSLPVSRINSRSAQESIYALTAGVNYVMVGVIGVWMSLISDISLLLILGVGLFFVDATTAFGATVIFASVATILHHQMHHKVKAIGERQSYLNVVGSQRIFEAVNSYRELLVRDRRGYYAGQIAQNRYQLADGTANITFMQNISKYVLELTLVASALLLAFYQFNTTTASRAIAVVTIFIAASTRITPAVLRVQQGLIQIKANLGQAKPAVSLMEELRSLNEVADSSKELLRNHKDFVSNVTAADITFHYVSGKEVLQKIHLEVKPGEFVALAGGSGAGKTTLVDVILGALEPQKGKVLISGLEPIKAFSKWPGAVSYVPQDSPIIDGTLRENLGLGYPPSLLTDEICWEVLALARLDDFIRSLPDGLDTQVGDRGTRLSGGQRQRLGIARSLVTRPKLLILDEATSSLDGLTESEISESLRKLKGDVTLIVIAHRLSTVVDADRIYFLDSGVVRAVGTFDELKTISPEFRVQAELMGL